MRVFVAIDVPPIQAEGFRVGSAPAHLTLRFLGECREEEIERIRSVLEPVIQRGRPFSIVLRGAGAFPDLERPRVVWIGIGEGAEELLELERAVSDALATIGIPREARPFYPHVTLFRIRHRGEAARARRTIQELGDRELGHGRVDEVRLKASELSPGGAIHRTIASWRLSGGPAVG